MGIKHLPQQCLMLNPAMFNCEVLARRRQRHKISLSFGKLEIEKKKKSLSKSKSHPIKICIWLDMFFQERKIICKVMPSVIDELVVKICAIILSGKIT